MDSAWRAGFKFLKRHNLVSCIDTRIQFFDDLIDLAAAFPDTLICIDHCAIPEARDDAYFKRWSTAMRKLAKADNVVMKISGLGMMDRRWTVESLRPWVLGSIEAFGTGPRGLWHQLAGRSDVQLLSRPDQCLCEHHLRLLKGRTVRDVLGQCRKAF